MEFHVRFETDMPDIAAVERALRELDPSALVDWGASGGLLRVAAWLDTRQLAEAFARAGCSIQPAQIVPLPSVCCGSCSG